MFGSLVTTLAVAVAPPRIEMNLEGMASAYKLKEPIIRSHDLKYQQNDNTPVKSRQDWTEKCAANRICESGDCVNSGTGWKNTGISTCPFPEAHGYDHQDKFVDVITRVFLVDIDGTPVDAANCEAITQASTFIQEDVACSNESDNACCVHPAVGQPANVSIGVDFTKRSTYLFKYDAMDNFGNHAEQVVFALILDDTEAPFFKSKCEDGKDFAAAITVEAVSDWTLCGLQAVDNVDGDIAFTSSQITYDIVHLGRFGESDVLHPEWNNKVKAGYFLNEEYHQNLDAGANYSTAKQFFTPRGDGSKCNSKNYIAGTDSSYSTVCGPEHIGKFLVSITVKDTAGLYGHNADDNVRAEKQAILIRDSVKPTIYLAGSNPTYVECRKDGGRATGTVAGDDWDYEAYAGSESDCKDKLDTVALGRYLPVTTTVYDVSTAGAQTDTGIFNIVGEDEAKKSATQNPLQTMVYPLSLDTRNFAIADHLRKLGTYHLKYDCYDFSNNKADPVKRTITTQDTHAPTLTLLDSKTGNPLTGDTAKVTYQLTEQNREDASTEPNADVSTQATAEDSCDSGLTVTMSWGPRPFNAKVLGDYVRTYTVSDASGNKAFKTRTYTVVDEADPIITPIDGYTNCADDGCSPGTFEATRDEEYTDSGASCHDFVDGELSHAVEVSGDIVNMRIPGTYTIQYDCQDLSGNEAPKEYRTVIIQDTVRPSLSLIGAPMKFVEAGFPYVDAGATATDSLDGDITQYIWTDGNTVTTQHAFYAQRSCAGILYEDENAQDGDYYITTETSKGNFQRELVGCFFENGKGYTYKLHYAGYAFTCSDLGMVQVTTSTPEGQKIRDWVVQHHATTARLVGNLDKYLCTVDGAVEKARHHDKWFQGAVNNMATADDIHNAEKGKYIINFHVEDKAGNVDCCKDGEEYLKRTVIVKDTLPPVITLKMKDKLVHVSEHSQVGILPDQIDGTYVHDGSMVNPAGYSNANRPTQDIDAYGNFGNPNLQDTDYMAESTHANRWLISAAISAVAGVAILGFSVRKASVTSVPV